MGVCIGVIIRVTVRIRARRECGFGNWCGYCGVGMAYDARVCSGIVSTLGAHQRVRRRDLAKDSNTTEGFICTYTMKLSMTLILIRIIRIIRIIHMYVHHETVTHYPPENHHHPPPPTTRNPAEPQTTALNENV